MIKLFDSHCHLDDEKFSEDLDEVIEDFKAKSVEKCLSLGTDIRSSQKNIEIAEKYDGIYCACGVHPHQAAEADSDYILRLNELLNNPKAIAVGEIGLDYFYDFSPREIQKSLLVSQIVLAKSRGLPAVYHVREAHGDMIDVLKGMKTELPKGVIHCYSGSKESAREYLNLGHYISFTGSITFKNASKIIEALSFVPLDRLLIETDSPYMTPVPHRGKRNTPAFVSLVCEKMAQVKNISYEEMAEISYNNAKKLFNI